MAATEVCDALERTTRTLDQTVSNLNDLALNVKEVATIVKTHSEHLRDLDSRHTELTALMAAQASSATDREGLHKQIDGLTGTLKWVVGISIPVALALLGMQAAIWQKMIEHVAAGH